MTKPQKGKVIESNNKSNILFKEINLIIQKELNYKVMLNFKKNIIIFKTLKKINL